MTIQENWALSMARIEEYLQDLDEARQICRDLRGFDMAALPHRPLDSVVARALHQLAQLLGRLNDRRLEHLREDVELARRKARGRAAAGGACRAAGKRGCGKRCKEFASVHLSPSLQSSHFGQSFGRIFTSFVACAGTSAT